MKLPVMSITCKALLRIGRRSGRRQLSQFAPAPVEDVGQEVLTQLTQFVDGNVVVLTGAGLSTESGIPDYRSPQGSYSVGHKPMTHQEFLGNATSRKRYWARAIHGFHKFSTAEPNLGHLALAYLQNQGKISTLITQNVDSLLQKAGATDVIELHGSGREIECQSCFAVSSRLEYHSHLEDLNDSWLQRHMPKEENQDIRADGDAHLSTDDFSDFQVTECKHCGEGIVKPKIVFFGGNVPQETREASLKAVENADKLLVVGSSVMVYSSFRLCKLAKELGKPLGIINIGETRADDICDWKLQVRIGETLDKLIPKLVPG